MSDATTTYAFVQDVPITRAMYARIDAGMGLEPPDGLVSHVVTEIEGGLRYYDVWVSKAAWEQFHDSTLHPLIDQILAEPGFEPAFFPPRLEELDIVSERIATPAATPS